MSARLHPRLSPGHDPSATEAEVDRLHRIEVLVLPWMDAHPWRLLLLTGAGAGLLAGVALWLSRTAPGELAGLWYANVWGLCCLVVAPRRHWPGLLLALGVGITVANALMGHNLLRALSFLPPNLCESWLGAVLLRATPAYQDISSSPSRCWSTLLRGSLLPALAGSTMAALLLGGGDFNASVRLWMSWFHSTVIGSASLLPLGLGLLSVSPAALRRQLVDPEALTLALLAVGVTVLSLLGSPYPFIYVTLPLVLAAVRLRFVAVTLMTWLAASTACLLIVHGLFAPPPLTSVWQQSLVYGPILALVLPPLLLAAAMEQSRLRRADLQRSQGRYRDLYERTPAMMHTVGPDGRILSVSELWLERLGQTRDEVIGRRLRDFLTDDARRALPEPDLDQTGARRDVELQLRRRDGAVIDVLLSATSERDAEGRITITHAVLEDVTRKRLAEQLAAEHERSRVTLESIGDAVISTDAAGRVEYLNPVAETLTGWPEERARGRLYAEVVHRRAVDGATELPDPVALCLHQRRRPPLPHQVRLSQAGGGEFVIQEAVTPMFDASGALIGAVAVFQDVSEAHALALQLAHRAQHDALTGLPNRLLLQDRLTQCLELARRHQHSFALMFMDIDHFKPVNDTLGHDLGDELLRQLAGRLHAHLRASDTASRLGGDEFVVLLPQIDQPGAAQDVAEHLLHAVAQPFVLDADPAHIAHVSLSIGLACYPQDGLDAATLMRHADAAMYRAKRAGRNRWMRFTPETEKAALL